MEEKIIEIREKINCKGKGCLSFWKEAARINEEKDNELRLYLEKCLKNIEGCFEAYDSNITPSARGHYLREIKNYLGRIGEYINTQRVKEYSESE